MPSFTFQAKDPDGLVRKGVMQAASREEAERRLTARGFTEIAIDADGPPLGAGGTTLGAVETTIKVLPGLQKKQSEPLGWRKRLSPDGGKGPQL